MILVKKWKAHLDGAVISKLIHEYQKRLIARLDIKGNRLIKGVRFEGVKVIGDPSEIIEDYLEKGIDELFIQMLLQVYTVGIVLEKS